MIMMPGNAVLFLHSARGTCAAALSFGQKGPRITVFRVLDVSLSAELVSFSTRRQTTKGMAGCALQQSCRSPDVRADGAGLLHFVAGINVVFQKHRYAEKRPVAPRLRMASALRARASASGLS